MRLTHPIFHVFLATWTRNSAVDAAKPNQSKSFTNSNGAAARLFPIASCVTESGHAQCAMDGALKSSKNTATDNQNARNAEKPESLSLTLTT